MSEGVEQQKPAALFPPAVSRLRRALSSARLAAMESIRTFQRHHAFETAATLSFYALLSAIPMLLLSVFFLSRAVLTSHDAMVVMEDLSARWSPEPGGALMREVRALSEQRIWTGISLLALFWIVTPFAATWRAAFERAFTETKPGSFLRAKLRDLLGTLTLWALFLLVVLGKIAEDALRSRFHVEIPPLMEIGGFLLSFGFSFLGLMLFYAVLEPVRPRFGPLAAGALTAAVLLFILRPGFSAFLRFNPNYGFAFGSLKAVFVLIMWGYWCFVVLLFAVEIAKNHFELIVRENPQIVEAMLREFARRLRPEAADPSNRMSKNGGFQEDVVNDTKKGSPS